MSYATGGTITTYNNDGTITYFHTFTNSNILNQDNTFEIIQDIPSGVNYILVGGGKGGDSGSNEEGYLGGGGGEGGSVKVAGLGSVDIGTTITITQIGVGGDSDNAMPPTHTVVDDGENNISSVDGTNRGANGYFIENYGNRQVLINGVYGASVASSGGDGGTANIDLKDASGSGGGTGNDASGGRGAKLTDSIPATDAQAAVKGDDSTQIGGGGGGGGGASGTVGPGGAGGAGGVIIYYTISGGKGGGGGSVCFLAGTPVETDQGEVAIDKLDTKVNTINGKRIVAVTETPGQKDCLVLIKKDLLGENMPNKDTVISIWHRVLYEEEMEEACRIPDTELVPYNGEILYNVLMDEHETMKVNGLIVETLDPDHKVAKFYKNNL